MQEISVLIKPLLWIWYKLMSWICKKESQKQEHDNMIFKKLTELISDELIIFVINQSRIAYLPKTAYGLADAMDNFLEDPSKEFEDPNLNKLFKEYAQSFKALALFYALCSHAEVSGSDTVKLLYYKDYTRPNEEESLKKALQKNYELSSKLEIDYRKFRKEIKHQLHI